MSLPRMSLHIGDYKKDTGHLSAAGHGAYLLLIMHYWATGGLPDDDRQLASIACLSAREWKRWKPILRALFDDCWRHGRIDKEIAIAEEKYRRRVEAGRLGGLAKAQHSPSIARAEPKQPITLTDKGREREEGGAITPEAFTLSDEILKAISEDREHPNWYGFPYLVQKWLTQKIPKEFIFSVCANLRGKHRNYLDKAVENGWRDKQSEPERKPGNAKASGNVVDASAQLRDRLRAFTGADAVGVGSSDPDVRLLPQGRG